MIKNLTISRFRGIKNGIIEDFGKINILAGENNSGKTSVLEALYWLSICGRNCRIYPKSFQPGLGCDIALPVKQDLLALIPCPRIWKRHGKPDIWTDSNGFVTEDGILSYSLPYLVKDKDLLKAFRIIPPQEEEIIDKEKFTEKDLKTISVFSFKKDTGKTDTSGIIEQAVTGIEDILKQYIPNLYTGNTLSDVTGNQEVAFSWYPDFIYNRESLATWSIDGETPFHENVLFFDFHTVGQNFAPEFDKIIKNIPDWRIKLSKGLSKIFNISNFIPSIEDMQGVIEPEGKHPISIDDFGDGARHAFKVLASLIVLTDRCTNGKEGIFLWEDPELFMHPKSLYLLLEEIINMTELLPVQIFLSTQSLDLIKSFANILNKKPVLKETSRVFRMELREGELISSKFTYKKLHAWLKHGSDPRFWNQREVIDYEADEEAVDEE